MHDALVTVSVSFASPPFVIVTVTSPSPVRLWSVKSPLQPAHIDDTLSVWENVATIRSPCSALPAVPPPSSNCRAVVVGAAFCTSAMTAAEVKVLPDLSVVTTRRSYWPSLNVLVFQVTP